MKKLMAAFACSAMIASSLASCNVIETIQNTYENYFSETNVPMPQTDIQTNEPESERMHPHYHIEEVARHTRRYTIYNTEGDAVFSEDLKYFVNLYMIGDSIVAICIDLGQEYYLGKNVYLHKYYDIKNNRLSGEYTNVIASTENLVAYWDFSAGSSSKYCALVVRDIYDETAFYKSFELKTELAKYHVDGAHFNEGEIDLVLYERDVWGGFSTTTYPIRRPVEQEELLRKQTTAMTAYSEALKNDIPVYEVNGTTVEPACRLKDLKTPYERIPLGEIEHLKYLYMDMDGDAINELVIDCGDILVLRYYEGSVYVYPFTFRGMYNLNTDGTYSWNHTGQNFEYGESRLSFDGVERKAETIWKVVNDGEAYYIGDREVSQAEFESYIENNPKTLVTFEPLETAWKNEISEEEALKIAEKYIKDTYGDERAYTFTPISKWDPNYSAYFFLVIGGADVFTEVCIDKYTGEVITSAAKG